MLSAVHRDGAALSFAGRLQEDREAGQRMPEGSYCAATNKGLSAHKVRTPFTWPSFQNCYLFSVDVANCLYPRRILSMA